MISLWAKLQRNDNNVIAWHSLVGHSADVAAVVEALLEIRTLRQRLAKAAGRDELGPITTARLGALSFLHDIGKANRGFQARLDTKAPLIGHIDQLAWVFHGEGPAAEKVCERMSDQISLGRVMGWFKEDPIPLFATLFAHHGRPWNAESPPDCRNYWEARPGSDPVADLAPMRAALDRWFPLAFEDGPPLPEAPGFQHAFAGLLMLADWIGSDATSFPFDSGKNSDRIDFARAKASEVVRQLGLDPQPFRDELHARELSFASAFGVPQPRPIQTAAIEPSANLIVIESETGSGKTEAALWRFADLLKQGAVDGLYFALPTRVAATQIFERVRHFRDRVFPGATKPAVVLAVPGQIRVDAAEGRLLPDFVVQWNDDPQTEGARLARWAAEHPKRFLAAPIAIGTIDQALLATLSVRHAHLRGTALLRQLLVVDEVHASDRYGEALLTTLLRDHLAAGGHALLLSATLGSASRARLLQTPAPSLQDAVRVPYPALTWAEEGQECHRSVPSSEAAYQKSVTFDARPLMDSPSAIAELTLSAAQAGAKVLVLRNTVAGAVAVTQAIEGLAGTGSPFLFRVGSVPTVHHSRFAPDDRRRLDRSVEAAMGRDRPDGGRVVVGTQTLEIALDLDADLLITDLCPVDVLLQRVGRLHRHTGRIRPEGFGKPRAMILTPANRDLSPLAHRGRHGLGSYVYDDLRIIEATWRLLEQDATWIIPEMNRGLVEAATHPACLEAIERELVAQDPAWRRHIDGGEGRTIAALFAAGHACLDRTKPFDTFRIDPDERLATRLGASDRHIVLRPVPIGPFGALVSSLKIPAHMLDNVEVAAEPAEVTAGAGEVAFRLGDARFRYDRLGLARER